MSIHTHFDLHSLAAPPRIYYAKFAQPYAHISRKSLMNMFSYGQRAAHTVDLQAPLIYTPPGFMHKTMHDKKLEVEAKEGRLEGDEIRVARYQQ